MLVVLNNYVVKCQKGYIGKNCIVDLDMAFFKNSYPPFLTPGGYCCALFSIMSRKTGVFLKDRVKDM